MSKSKAKAKGLSPKQQRDRAIRLYRQGVGVREIERRTGVPSWMVSGLALADAFDGSRF